MNQEIIDRQYKAHTGNIQGLHFKKIGNNLCDVFEGIGFATPTRYRLIKGTWVHLSGPRLGDAVAKLLK